MYSRVSQVLEQYDFEVSQSRKGRGTLICETSKGLKVLKVYQGSEERAEFLYNLLLFLKEEQGILVDDLVKTKEEKLVVEGLYDYRYYMRNWYNGRECDVHKRADLLRGAELLGRLHKATRLYTGTLPVFIKENDRSTLNEFSRHNRELKKIRTYIYKKKQKNDFERLFLAVFPEYFEEALEAERSLYVEKNEFLWGITHNDYNYHNLMFTDQGLAVTNFEQARWDLLVEDLSNYLRKIMEKNDWDVRLGEEIMRAYEKERPLTKQEKQFVCVANSYPLKFWKIANHYQNSRKSWNNSRNMEKLEEFIRQNKERERFLKDFSKI